MENTQSQKIDKTDKKKTIWKKSKKINTRPHHRPHPTPINLQENPLETIYTTPAESTYKEKFISMISGKEGFGFDTSICQNIGESLKPIVDFLNEIITKPSQYLDKFETFVSTEIYNIFSTSTEDNATKDDDIQLIKKEFQMFITVFISIYIVYNWYYLQFYNLGKKLKLYEISTQGLKNLSSVASLFFKYTIVPLSLLNSLCIQYFPQTINFITNVYFGKPVEPAESGMKETKHGNKINFILLYFLIILLFIYIGPTLQANLINDINMQPDAYANLYISSYFLFAIASIFIVEKSMITELFADAAPQNVQPIIRGILPYFGFYLHKMQIAYMPIPTFLLFILRIMWSMSIVWLSGLLVVLYIFIYSFFSIFIYSNDSLFSTIETINISITKNAEKKKDELSTGPCGNLKDPSNPCNTDDIFTKIYYYLEKAVDFCINNFYKFIFEMTFIILLIKSIIDYNDGLKNVSLKSVLMIICSIFIFIFGFIIYYRNKSKIQSLNLPKDTIPEDAKKTIKNLFDIFQ